MGKRRQLNIRLTEHDEQLLDEVCQDLGLTRTRAVLMGLESLRSPPETAHESISAPKEELEGPPVSSSAVLERRSLSDAVHTASEQLPEMPILWPPPRLRFGLWVAASQLPEELWEYHARGIEVVLNHPHWGAVLINWSK